MSTSNDWRTVLRRRFFEKNSKLKIHAVRRTCFRSWLRRASIRRYYIHRPSRCVLTTTHGRRVLTTCFYDVVTTCDFTSLLYTSSVTMCVDDDTWTTCVDDDAHGKIDDDARRRNNAPVDGQKSVIFFRAWWMPWLFADNTSSSVADGNDGRNGDVIDYGLVTAVLTALN